MENRIETHRYYLPPKRMDGRVSMGDGVPVHAEYLPRGFWRLGRIEELAAGADRNIRGAAVRVVSRGQNPTIINS